VAGGAAIREPGRQSISWQRRRWRRQRRSASGLGMAVKNATALLDRFLS